ncbi:unnamed protein product [Rotaria sp. Silwood1]|nr:unnamed protein product [Rotaria sp. Silwood1]
MKRSMKPEKNIDNVFENLVVPSCIRRMCASNTSPLVLTQGVKASCSIKSKKKRSLNVISYTITIFIFVYLIQIIIIIVTNVRNFHLVRKHRLLTTIRLNESHSQRQYLLEYRITYTIIFIIGSGYILVWTPYATVADLGF